MKTINKVEGKEIDLLLKKYCEAVPEKGWVPKFVYNIVLHNANKIEWYDNKLNLIDTKFNFSEKFITKFSVKNLDLPYITFKLTGDYGEKVSKRINLIAYK